MFTEITQYLERILVATNVGNLIEVVTGSHYAIFVKTSEVNEVIKSLWPKIVYDLSSKGLINGILDVPVMHVNNRLSACWIKDLEILCSNSPEKILKKENWLMPQRPLPPTVICLAIGGPSGVGKSTLIKKLFESSVGDRARRYIAYTTRPMRSHEIHGIDYFFVDSAKLQTYQSNPRFINFVEARGSIYWSDPVNFFESRWRDKNLIHIFAVTQVHEFIERRRVIPDLLWVWLDASDEELRRRLDKRGDVDIEKSVQQNQRLKNQDRNSLVNLKLTMETGRVDEALKQLMDFITKKERKEI